MKADNKQKLLKRFPVLFGPDFDFENEESFLPVLSLMVKKGHLIRLADMSFKVKPTEDSAAANNSAPNPEKKKKWPTRVSRAAEQGQFDYKGIYQVILNGNTWFNKVLLGIVLVLTLGLFMFPAWPMYLKVAAVHFMVTLSSTLLFITILRLILYVIVWTIGADFWLFPNMNDEYLGIIDSFKPFYSFEWRKDEKFMLLLRWIGIVVIALACYQLSQTHTLQDVSDFVTTAYLDAVEWSVDKITKGPNAGRALPSWEQIQKETEGFEEI
jgi:translocation protein SEC62